jgi:hypothetical protein
VRVLRPASLTEAVDELNALAETGNVEYSMQLFRCDDAGNEGEDLTPYVAKGSAVVSRDCPQEVAGKLNVTLAKPLQWGADQVKPLLLARSPERPLPGDAFVGFPLGQFVVTSPGRDNLDATGLYSVTGYDRCYLLQSKPARSFSFAAGSTYADAVLEVMRAAGVIGPAAALDTQVIFPGEWAEKVIPVGPGASFPMGGGQSHIQIVNSLLKSSGCREIYTDPQTACFTIELIPVPAEETLAWRWQGTERVDPTPGWEGWPLRKIILYAQQAYTGDVYNATNRWVFIQSGLTFQPVEGAGQYTVDNLGDPPAGQQVVGRVIADVQSLDASGQADLVKQGDAIVAAEKAKTETVRLETTPWPAAGHFDVFQYHHADLPFSPLRRLQAQSWTLPLDGSAMTWACDVAALL